MKVQRQSEGIKHGEPEDHRLGVERVKYYWLNHNTKLPISYITESWTEDYRTDQYFMREMRMKRTNKDHFIHSPDLAVYDEETDELGRRYRWAVMFIEIDGPSHDSRERRRSDGIFQSWVERMVPSVKLVRINLRELIGEINDCNTWLDKVLKPHLQ